MASGLDRRLAVAFHSFPCGLVADRLRELRLDYAGVDAGAADLVALLAQHPRVRPDPELGGRRIRRNYSTRKPLDKCLARVARMFYVCSAPPSQPIVDLNRGVSVAGIAARGPDGNNGVRRQMAPQRVEMIESGCYGDTLLNPYIDDF
jgi:hypothetical protein